MNKRSKTDMETDDQLYQLFTVHQPDEAKAHRTALCRHQPPQEVSSTLAAT
jgi:hypothetical protein